MVQGVAIPSESPAVPIVLSVDDRESSRYVRNRALSAAGFKVIEAATGTDAIRLALERQPSLIVLDVRLPDISGFTVCEQLKSDPRTSLIPVLHVSAAGRIEDDLPEALEHQSDAYLQEPIAPETLVATARALIRTRDAERRAREAEDRARRAERHAAEILESIADPVIAFDREWCATYVNQRAANALGRASEDLLGLSCQDLDPGDDGQLVSACERSFAKKLPTTLERFSKASSRWHLAHIYPFDNGVSIQWRDITDTKRTEQALRETQERVQRQLAEIEALYETAPVGLCVLDDQLRWVRLNRRMAEMNGAPIKAHIGKTPREVLPAIGDQAEAALRRVLETGEPLLDFEIIGITPAQPGVVRSWNDRWIPLKDNPGRVIGISVAAEETTERRRAEEALRESEQRFRAMADNIAQFAWMADADGRIYWYNRRWHEYTGTTLDEVRDWAGEGVIHPDHRKRVVDGFKKSLQTGQVWEDTFPLRGKNGEYRWFLSRAMPIRDSEGRIVTWFGTNTDVTQQLELQRQLRDSEARLETILNQMPSGVIVMDAALRQVVVFSEQAKRILQSTSPRALSHTEMVHPEGQQYGYEEPPLVRAARGETIKGEDVILRREDGSHATLNVRAAPVRDRSGQIIATLMVFDDVTERRRAQRELSEAMQRLNAHIDNSPLAVIEFDPEFRVTRWSEEAEKIFGWTAKEMLGQSIGEVRWVYEEDAEGVYNVSAKMRDRTRARNVNVNRNYTKDGSIIECEWYNSAIYDEQGNLTSIFAQVLDVTERRRTEERLRQAQKTQSIAVLAAGLAHDFNNLLVGVIGNASMGMEMVGPDNPLHGLLERIIHAGERAAHLTKQVLAYSGQGRFVIEPVDLSEVVADLLDLVRSTIPYGIDLKVDLASGLPAIAADRSQVQQVLMNLVINATEAIDAGSGTISVKTLLREVDARFVAELEHAEIAPGQYVTLEVADTGCGMDKETQESIFDPFFTTKFQGRGLGLPASAGIVRGHKGAIKVSSTPGKGSSFLVLFPPAERSEQTGPAA